MESRETIKIAIGGGDVAEATEVLDEIFAELQKAADPRIVVMTIATDDIDGASAKYNAIFRRKGVRHVEFVDVVERSDAFSRASLRKIERADAIYFTGGDQLNVTALMGGSPLHDTLHEKVKQGVILAGSSAGAAMMSASMIISGKNDEPPTVGGVEIAPGMDFIGDTIIDTHFSQRGRHGRLLTAIAHHPQMIGLGMDECTAIVVHGRSFRVIGPGTVTVIDSSAMQICDLPHRRNGEVIGMTGVRIAVLPSGYQYDLTKREAIGPKFKSMAGNTSDE